MNRPTRLALLAAAALIACDDGAPLAPIVSIVADDHQDAYLDGAYAWAPLGFRAVDLDRFAADGSSPPRRLGSASPGSGTSAECGTDWWITGAVDCQLTISIVRDPLLRARRGTDALSDIDLRRIAIDASVPDGFQLAIYVAHELGHVLLQTTEHTRTGVMAGADVVLSNDDRDLACRAVNLCERN